MTTETLQTLARLGAERRLEELQEEIKTIHAFLKQPIHPALAARTQAAIISDTTKHMAVVPQTHKARRRFSRTQRRAISLRMKKYWAAQRQRRDGASIRMKKVWAARRKEAAA
jgi:hypothetical protein